MIFDTVRAQGIEVWSDLPRTGALRTPLPAQLRNISTSTCHSNLRALPGPPGIESLCLDTEKASTPWYFSSQVMRAVWPA